MGATKDIDDAAGEWFRLERNRAAVDLDCWPGPIGPDHLITATGGRFEFDRTDHDVDGAPEHVHRWHSN